MAGIKDKLVEKEYKYRNIAKFWSDMADIKDRTTGALKYPKLSKLALHCLLVLPQGNSGPARCVSVMKNILQVHNYSTTEDTFIAQRFIHYILILKGGRLKIHLSKDFFNSCRGARSSYVAFLKAQKLEQKMEKNEKSIKNLNERKRKKKDKKSDVLKRLESDLELLHAGIRVAEDAVEEGNTDFGELTAKKPLDINKLKMCQA